jgi:hypothetical protein
LTLPGRKFGWVRVVEEEVAVPLLLNNDLSMAAVTGVVCIHPSNHLMEVDTDSKEGMAAIGRRIPSGVRVFHGHTLLIGQETSGSKTSNPHDNTRLLITRGTTSGSVKPLGHTPTTLLVVTNRARLTKATAVGTREVGPQATTVAEATTTGEETVTTRPESFRNQVPAPRYREVSGRGGFLRIRN